MTQYGTVVFNQRDYKTDLLILTLHKDVAEYAAVVQASLAKNINAKEDESKLNTISTNDEGINNIDDCDDDDSGEGVALHFHITALLKNSKG